MHLFNLIFPRRCFGCSAVGAYFCDRCLPRIERLTEADTICPMCGKPALSGFTHTACRRKLGLDRLVTFVRFRGAIRRAVKALKYRFATDVAVSLGQFMSDADTLRTTGHASATGPELRPTFTLVPVPLYRNRFMYRGFNQAEILGNLLAQKVGIPVQSELLFRKRRTLPQVEAQSRKERLENMTGVFACRQSPGISATVLLFDDVWTTGATLRAAGMELKKAGIRTVWAVTLAR